MRKLLAIATLALLCLAAASCGLIGGSDDESATTTASTTTAKPIPVPAKIKAMAPEVVTELEDIKDRTIAVQKACTEPSSAGCAAQQATLDSAVADGIALGDRIDDATDEPLPEVLALTQSLGEELYCASIPGDLCAGDVNTVLTILGNLALTIDAWKAIA